MGIEESIKKHPAGNAKETPAHLKFMDGDSPKQTEYTQGFYKGAIYERERIIKLLEAECCELTDCRCEMRIKWAIALIKGENK